MWSERRRRERREAWEAHTHFFASRSRGLGWLAGAANFDETRIIWDCGNGVVRV